MYIVMYIRICEGGRCWMIQCNNVTHVCSNSRVSADTYLYWFFCGVS
jgi:hypothetical protein